MKRLLAISAASFTLMGSLNPAAKASDENAKKQALKAICPIAAAANGYWGDYQINATVAILASRSFSIDNHKAGGIEYLQTISLIVSSDFIQELQLYIKG